MSIRVIALAIIQREDGKLLVEKGYDSAKDEYFYRPLGGGVEFGEISAEAVVREMQEELHKTVESVELWSVTENIFEYEGDPGHQIMFLQRCRFTDLKDYAQETFTRYDGNDPDTVCWRSLKEIQAEGAQLYPEFLAKNIGNT